jgi:hypothetical protein
MENKMTPVTEMTILDMFACDICASIIGNNTLIQDVKPINGETIEKAIARQSYEMAQSMIEAREKLMKGDK